MEKKDVFERKIHDPFQQLRRTKQEKLLPVRSWFLPQKIQRLSHDEGNGASGQVTSRGCLRKSRETKIFKRFCQGPVHQRSCIWIWPSKILQHLLGILNWMRYKLNNIQKRENSAKSSPCNYFRTYFRTNFIPYESWQILRFSVYYICRVSRGFHERRKETCRCCRQKSFHKKQHWRLTDHCNIFAFLCRFYQFMGL